MCGGCINVTGFRVYASQVEAINDGSVIMSLMFHSSIHQILFGFERQHDLDLGFICKKRQYAAIQTSAVLDRHSSVM